MGSCPTSNTFATCALVSLRAAFAPAVVGVGFLRDVLGAPAEAAADPDFDTRALAGFSPEEIARAEAWALGTGSLTDAPFLGEAPLDMAIREGSDAGAPVMAVAPESSQAAPYLALAEKVRDAVAGSAVKAPKITIG